MKKHLIALLAMAACLTSCQKDFTTLRITAEAYDGSDAKLHVESGYACWDNGDTVMINGDEYQVAVSGNNASIADVEIAGTYRGVYPASMVQSANESSIMVNLPTVQRYRTNAAGDQLVEVLMAGVSQGGTIKFHNMESLLKITFTPTLSCHVRKIKVQADNNQSLSGCGLLAVPSDETFINFMMEGGSDGCDSVVLDCGLGVAVTENVSKDFYIAIPPTTSSTHLTITITDDFQSYSHTLSSQFNTGRNNIYTLGFAASAEGVTRTPNDKPFCNQIFYTLNEGMYFSASALLTAFGAGSQIQDFNGKKILTAPNPIVEIPGNVFDNVAYSGNHGLRSVVLPEGVTKIGDEAFASCWGMSQVHIPSSVTEIGESAFWGAKLTAVDLPAGLTSLGNEAFGLTSLHTINLPAGITEVPDELCISSALYELNLPEGVTKIGKGAFSRCNVLGLIHLPNSLVEIDEEAFAHYQAVSDRPRYDITIPAGVQTIGDKAFADQGNLYSQTIHMKPLTAPAIGTDVFSDIVDTIYIPQGATGYDQGNWTQYADKIHTENQQ